jgi:hypothetical protein
VDERVDIPTFNRHPIDRFLQFTEDVVTRTPTELKEWSTFSFPLTHEPANKDKILVYVAAPKPTTSGAKSKSGAFHWTFTANHDYRLQKHFAKVNYAEILAKATKSGVKRTWPVRLTIEYPIRPSLDGE